MPDDSALHRPAPSRLAGIARVFEDAVGLDPRTLAMVGALAVIWVGFALMTEGIFLSPRNLYNLAVQSTVVGIMATGMVLVIVARHIDLSVGSIVGTTGMVIAALQVEVFPLGAAWNWPLTIVIGLAIGAAIGSWQGYWIAYRGVPAFVVTLAGLLMFRGMAWLITEGRTVAPMDTYYQWLGGGIDGSIGEVWSWIAGALAIAILGWVIAQARASRKRFGFPVKALSMEITAFAVWSVVVAGFVMIMNAYDNPLTNLPRGIPIPVLILIVVVIAMSAVTKYTRFGRYVYAMGGNPEAAQLAGINVKRTTLLIFTLMGVLCAVAAVVTTARLNAGTNSMGMLAELSVISAAVIGGTSFAGGIGSIAGAILGAVVMQSLENGMVLMGVSSAMRQVIIGFVLVAAVWFDVATRGGRR